MIIADMTRILRFFVNSFCTKGIGTKIYYLYFMSCKYSLIDFLIQLSTCLRFKGFCDNETGNEWQWKDDLSQNSTKYML